jgi:hypothetical protein
MTVAQVSEMDVEEYNGWVLFLSEDGKGGEEVVDLAEADAAQLGKLFNG